MKYTLKDLAGEKKLPLDWLKKQLGIRELGGGAIGILYFDETGQELFERRRNPPGAKDRFYQPKGIKLLPYGLNRLDVARQAGHIYLCEGETDTWTMWHCSLPALGLPGANAALRLTAEHLVGIRSINLLPDNDRAGEQMVEGVRKQLAELGYAGRLNRVTVPAPHKDVSEWYVTLGNPHAFRVALIVAVEDAKQLPVEARRPPRNGISTNSCRRDEADPDRREPAPRVRALRVRTFASITSAPTSWLWTGYVPLGAITILDGDPGLGKSTITADLAARVSRGGAMPPLAGKTDLDGPADVLILNAEDSPEQTMRPRLDAAGADATKVHVIEATKLGEEDERPPVLPADLDLLDELVCDRGVKLILIDPYMAYLDGELDAHRDQDVRRCLHRLKMLAEQTGAAVVLVRHLNKLTGGPAIYRGGGSIGISGAARSVLMVGKNQADPKQLVLAAIKCNLCAMPPALTYSIETADNGVSVIGWGDETTLSADELLGQRRQGASVAQECADTLLSLLADGPKPVTDVEDELCANGYTANAIREARKLAKVRAVREGGLGQEGRWLLHQPGDPPPEDADPGRIPPGW